MNCFKMLSAFALVLAVSGCSQLTQTRELLRSSGIFGKPPPPPNIRANLTPEALKQIGQPILFVERLDLGVQAGLLVAARNKSVVTWRSQDNFTVSLDGGIITATRGQGGDLMSADVSQAKQAILKGRSEAKRVHTYRDGEDNIVYRGFVCRYERFAGQQIKTIDRSYRATKVVETCNNVDDEITNNYWVDQTGKIRMSEQWIGYLPGHLYTELLND